MSVNLNESLLKGRNGQLGILLDMSNLLSTTKDLSDLIKGALSKVLEWFGLEVSVGVKSLIDLPVVNC